MKGIRYAVTKKQHTICVAEEWIPIACLVGLAFACPVAAQEWVCPRFVHQTGVDNSSKTGVDGFKKAFYAFINYTWSSGAQRGEQLRQSSGVRQCRENVV